MRSMTNSPVALAREALKVAQASLSPYSSPFSRKEFTQYQLFAIIQMLDDVSNLRGALGLKKVPHHSTLSYAQKRLLKKGLSSSSWEPFSTTPAPSA